MQCDNTYCENLYYSLCEFFEKDPKKYRTKIYLGQYRRNIIVEILPKGYYEVLDNLRNTQYYNAVEFHFRDNVLRYD